MRSCFRQYLIGSDVLGDGSDCRLSHVVRAPAHTERTPRSYQARLMVQGTKIGARYTERFPFNLEVTLHRKISKQTSKHASDTPNSRSQRSLHGCTITPSHNCAAEPSSCRFCISSRAPLKREHSLISVATTTANKSLRACIIAQAHESARNACVRGRCLSR